MKSQITPGSEFSQEDTKEVINAVLEWTKQITTLASGTLVLSATFVKDIFESAVEYQWFLVSSWILFAASALFGVLLMGNLCYLFSSRSIGKRTIYNSTTRVIGVFHLVTFMLGLVLFVFFASYNFILTNSNMY